MPEPPPTPRPATRAATTPEGEGSRASPCIRQCCLDDADECIGCGRTLDEIKGWHDADAAGREAILQAAAARRAARTRRFPSSR